MAGKRDWGRVRQLKSGRWQARYPGPDGVLRPATNTFARKSDASKWLADKRSEIEREEWTNPDDGKIPLREYTATWLKERGLAETTYERNEGILRNHIWPTLGDKGVADVKEATIRRWRAHLLEAGVGGPTVAKAYRLMHAIFTTAADEDRLVRRNPCRIKGAGADQAAERPILTIDEVFAVADAIQPRYRVLVLLGAVTSLRFGEFAALRRRDVDLAIGEIRVHRSQAELKGGRTLVKAPKSDAGRRRVTIPDVAMPELRRHLLKYSGEGPDGLLFVGPQGGQLRRRNFHRLWTRALDDAGVAKENVHFHDLRHTGNHLAASTGASTKELMARMGHSSMRAALIYQHATRDRDQQIADAISKTVRESGHGQGHPAGGSDGKGHARGTRDDQVS